MKYILVHKAIEQWLILEGVISKAVLEDPCCHELRPERNSISDIGDILFSQEKFDGICSQEHLLVRFQPKSPIFHL